MTSHRNPCQLFVTLALVAYLGSACAGHGESRWANAPPASDPKATGLVAGNAWIRLPGPGPVEYPAAFLALQNREPRERTLVGGSGPRVRSLEIHRAVLREGFMGAEVLSQMTIPALGAVAFAPRGLSLVLVGAEPLEPGDTVALRLDFADGEHLEVEAVVRAR